LLDVTSYAVELDLTGLVDGSAFTSTTVVSFTCREPGATTFLELDGELLELVRGGAPMRPDMQGNRIVLADLAAHEVVRVVARCTTTRTGEGLHRSVDPADGQVYLYAQAFLDDAQRIFACFDQPDLKARVQLTVTAPAAWTVLANTRAVRDGSRHVFAPTEPIATYLVTLAARRAALVRRRRARRVVPGLARRAPRGGRAVHDHRRVPGRAAGHLRAALPVR
jgi:aminopeptidase N